LEGIRDLRLLQPSPKESQLYFPVIGSSKSFKDATFHKINLPDELRKWLHLIQPCNAAERLADSNEAEVCEALVVINECAKWDRHRKLHLVGAYVIGSTAFVEVTPPAVIVHQEAVTSGNYFEGDFVVAKYTIEGRTSDTEVRANGRFSVHVSVQEIPPALGAELGAQLWRMQNVVRFTIEQFEKSIS